MIAKDKNILSKVLEVYLKTLQDDTVRGKAITEFLYNCEDHTVAAPTILWLASEYLYNICLESGNETDTDIGVYAKSRCVRRQECKEKNRIECKAGWIFPYKDNNFINITLKPEKTNILKCGLTSEEYGKLREICRESKIDCYFKILLGVLLLRESLYRYGTDVECYTPMKFYESIMTTLFLFSFDAFYWALKFCIRENVDTLSNVIRDSLECILELAENGDEQVKGVLFSHTSYTARIIRCAISDTLIDSDVINMDNEQRLNLIKEIVNLANGFYEQMKSDKYEMKKLLTDNKTKVLSILGGSLVKKLTKIL
ncbi:MAG: hypothetical protein HDR88_17300 [Bacteroides sp.]|nr:hypothetical protein [Bacteroides sp.]